ncbi:pyruvate kinase [Gloeocapsa sp. PCC 73106]|uniref:pyruvate kinase n=1 Tax=Gloeocapsa sp. PCC 73106 TaxID=102232 RepID=UPI0002ABAAA2|nr:pyruvate kinase [Gloeocapsa sp. PCC 73106]ELR97507.1 pyruvate kinase [Gloeocapsa sp. PCC 73106]
MKPLNFRTKIVATIGPASNNPEVLREMLLAGLNVARLNFSHGTYEVHGQMIKLLRSLSAEMDLPLTLLQDLQGPKIRVGELPPEGMNLVKGASLTLVPIEELDAQAENTVGIDYPYVAEEAKAGTPVLLDDGLLELAVESIEGNRVTCKVVQGGILKSHKGVNLPTLNLRLPSMTEKDKKDLEFGISQGVDIVSLSFVRKPEDIQELKEFLAARNAHIPVLAKIEKPQAIENIEAIVDECDAIMVARGDLGVEMRPETVPMIQKRVIRVCNQKGVPVITATQMLDSMIHNPRPTRAEASDVANAIIDGTDAVMLSGESAVGAFPVQAVKMLASIATDVEPEQNFTNYPPRKRDRAHALAEAINDIDKILDLQCIIALTETGNSALLAGAERPRVPVVALTPHIDVYHRLNLVWGVRPLVFDYYYPDWTEFLEAMEKELLKRNFVQKGDKVLILGGMPLKGAKATTFIDIHIIGELEENNG